MNFEAIDFSFGKIERIIKEKIDNLKTQILENYKDEKEALEKFKNLS